MFSWSLCSLPRLPAGLILGLLGLLGLLGAGGAMVIVPALVGFAHVKPGGARSAFAVLLLGVAGWIFAYSVL
jgi:hypothetical protein